MYLCENFKKTACHGCESYFDKASGLKYSSVTLRVKQKNYTESVR